MMRAPSPYQKLRYEVDRRGGKKVFARYVKIPLAQARVILINLTKS